MPLPSGLGVVVAATYGFYLTVVKMQLFHLRWALRYRGFSFVWQQKKQKCLAAFLLA
jgi:hypothetical protein